MASRLETAIRMQEVNKAMGQTVKGMANAMKSMEVEQIAKTMADFEKQFEDMDVRSGEWSNVFLILPPIHTIAHQRLYGEHNGKHNFNEHPSRTS